MESSLLLTDNILDKINNNIPFNIKFDQHHNNKTHFRGKCGEIYIENGKYIINCNFCNESFIDLCLLIKHNYYKHFLLRPPEIIEHLNNNDDDDTNQPKQQPTPKQITSSINNSNTIETNIILYNKLNIDPIQFSMDIHKEIETDRIDNDLGISERPKKIRDKYGLYSCEYCTRSYIHYVHLKYHCLEHNYPKEFRTLPQSKQVCNEKSKYFDNNNDKLEYQLDQIKRKPNNDGQFQCEICGKNFTKFRYYRTHTLQVHQSNLNPYKCEYCSMSFILKQSLTLHERTHTGEKPFKCPYCPRGFALNQNLRRHINIHLGEKPYQCSYCDMKFTQPNSKKSHERNIHTKERPHQCELCGKAYPRSTLLKEHYKRHTNTRPFECKICNRTYFDNAALKNHLYTHTGNKIYECEVCLKKFKTIKCLKSHQKLHLSIKNYKCTICDEEFAQHAGLYSHMKIRHNNVMRKDELIVL